MSSIAEQALGALLSGAKGAAAGAALGPAGSIAGGAIGVAMDLLPSAAHWLGADEDTAQKVVQTVQTVTGATTAPEQRAALAADPAMADDLRVQLAQIAAERAAEDNRSLEARLSAQFADVANARAQTVQLAGSSSRMAWGSTVMTIIVMLVNAALILILLTRSYPAENKDIVLLLVGQVLGWGTAAVAYWLGSSSGSSDKSQTISDLSHAALAVLPKPAEIKPANKGA